MGNHIPESNSDMPSLAVLQCKIYHLSGAKSAQGGCAAWVATFGSLHEAIFGRHYDRNTHGYHRAG